MIKSKSKTVYILGAGASAAARLPIQNRLVEMIFKITEPPPTESSFLSDESENLLAFHYNNFMMSRRYLAEFLILNYVEPSKRNDYEAIKKKYASSESFLDDTNTENEWIEIYGLIEGLNVPLEDIFTTLDKAELNNEHFGIYNIDFLKKVKRSLNNCIIYMLSFHINQIKDNKLYNDISKFLVELRLKGDQKDDPFSIITLNWDTLLDSTLYNQCVLKKNNNVFTISPDYCCYNYDLSTNVPSTHIKAKGLYNIKIMKPHGSINWLICPNCGRLFTDFNKQISLVSVIDQNQSEQQISCSYCKNEGRSTFLNPVLITPTFIKDINNLHLKNIWHNAYLDLCEASEIVFLGYSLPDADFELKYILKKALMPHVKIRVILHQSDDPRYYSSLLKKCGNDDEIRTIFSRLNLPELRYKNFFGNHDIKFKYNGIEDYFDYVISYNNTNIDEYFK